MSTKTRPPVPRLRALLAHLPRPARRRGPGPVGFDLAAERLNLVQVEPGPGGTTVRAAAAVPYPCPREELLAEPRRFRTFVRQALGARPFAGRRVVASMPIGAVKLAALHYRRAPDQDEESAIVRALREQLGAELEDAVVDYLPVRSESENDPARTALTVVASREAVGEHLGLLDAAGLEVEALDIGPAALQRLVAALDREQRHPNVMLVNFGRESSFLTVIWGRRLMLDRAVEFGESRLVRRLEHALEVDAPLALQLLRRHGLHVSGAAADAGEDLEVTRTLTEILQPALGEMLAEVGKTLLFTASETRGGSVERLYLVGSVARYPHVAAFLADRMGMAVEVLDPLTAFDAVAPGAVAEGLDSVACIAVAAGLALREG